MIQIAICDDDPVFIENVKNRIVSYLQQKEIENYGITEFVSSASCYESMKAGMTFDVMFLDITMPEMSGLDLAKKIRKYNDTVILIFMTAFLDYAMEGYRLQVLRYILKDMIEELLPECMDTIISKLTLEKTKMEYSFVEGRYEINIKNIVYIESNKHKLLFHMKDGKDYSLYDKLDHMESKLQPFSFLRIHKSYLANMEYIEEMSNYHVTLVSGESFSVPRERFQEARKRYYSFRGGLL